MSFRKRLLLFLARRWPSPLGQDHYKYRVNREEVHKRYFWERYGQVQRRGLPVDVHGLRVLEIGSGHGSVSHFVARNYARQVVGIDVNVEDMQAGRQYALNSDGTQAEFCAGDAHTLPFADTSFDLIIADNVFEHFMDPACAMREAFRVLVPGGTLYVPTFCSIWSKYGAHMKTYVKVPWCNVLFSEKFVVETLAELAKENPRIVEDYPRLTQMPLPTCVREVRRYGDLNGITHRMFRHIAESAGFQIVDLNIHYVGSGRLGRILSLLRIPYAADVLSLNASAMLRKPD